MNIALLIVFLVLSSFVLTELIRRYTIKSNLLDIPNERSSHAIPTPRGGGLSIVIVFMLALNFIEPLPGETINALVGSGLLIAAVGFWDDHKHIPAKWRLLSHFVAVFWALYCLERLPSYEYVLYEDWLLIVLISFFLVWVLNLFNFMDGIDGIAASEAIFVSVSAALFLWLSGLEMLANVLLILAAATSGFLFLNWPTAKIFMGDVGSGFLGIMLGILAYISIDSGIPVYLWLILFAVFIVDSGITLFRRILNKEKWYEAHCSHAYQYAAKIWGHKRVTVATIIINIFWLLPLAYLSNLYVELYFILLVIAYIPIILIAIKYKAGISFQD